MEEQLIEIFTKNLFLELSAELERQDHVFTGSLMKSFESKVEQKTNSIDINVLMNDYGLSLNNGIPANRIPYTPPPPFRGGRSKFIQGLIRWVKLKLMPSRKRAESVAFAIANKMSKKGYPLTGKIGFIDITLEKEESNIIEFIENYVEMMIDKIIKEYLGQFIISQ